MTGAWETRGTDVGPLVNGANAKTFSVADLDGRHAVRVVVDGALGSPLILGVLELDRSPPQALDPAIRAEPDGLDVKVSWTQQDAGVGTDPVQPMVVEINDSPAGDGAGAWIPFLTQSGLPGDGSQSARTSAAALADGAHLVQVRSTDKLGNTGAQPLGTVTLDRRPPLVSDVRLLRAPTEADATADVSYTAIDPQPGLGVAPDARAVASDPSHLPTYGEAPRGGPIRLTFSGPGTYQVTVGVTDRAGLVGWGGPITVVVPAVPPPPGPADRIDFLTPGRPDGPPGPGVVAAYRAAQRLAATRNVRLNARLASERTAAGWRRLLGTDQAGGIEGYATLQGRLLIGPRASAALEELRRARTAVALRAAACRRTKRPASCRPAPVPPRVDLDRMVFGLSVLLHESIHASGPAFRDDFRDTPSGRSFEEGFTEAATVDLLPRYVRALRAPARLEAGLLRAARRYRPVYPGPVGWVRDLSAQATGAGAASPAATRWRVGVADHWGADRWQRLARAVGSNEAALRAAAPPLFGDQGRR